MKKCLGLIVMFLSLSQVVFASFTDVSDDEKEILWLQENGVVQGYEDGTFRPDNTVNRAEFLKMIYETIGMKGLDAGTSMENNFLDVANDAWYTKYIVFASSVGGNHLISGYKDGTFKPDNPINFAEAFKIVQRAFFTEWDPNATWQYSYKYDPCYKDLGASNWDKWYWGFIQFLDNYCIIPEEIATVGDEFDASRGVTRRDMAKLLYRAQAVRYNSKQGYSNVQGYSTVFSKYNDDMIPWGIGAFRVPADFPMVISTPDLSDDDGWLTTNYRMFTSKYTCEGEDVNPSLTIENVPEGTKSLVLILDDPDASSGVWTHWILWNIDPDVKKIEEDSVPAGVVEGLNSWGSVGYKGPCPSLSAQSMHEYYFKIYALDDKLELNDYITGAELLKALLPHLLNSGWTGGLFPHY